MTAGESGEKPIEPTARELDEELLTRPELGLPFVVIAKLRKPES
jgi:hypothetical protein